MAIRLPRPALAATGVRDETPDWMRAVLAGWSAAAVGALLTFLPIVVIWLASPSATVGVDAVVRIGIGAWALGHGVPVTTAIGTLSVIPLLLTVLLIWGASWPASRLASRLQRGEPTRVDWLGRLRRDVAAQGAVFVLTYGLTGLLGCLLARSDEVSPSMPWAALAFPVVGLLAYLHGLRREFRDDLAQVAPGWRVTSARPADDPGQGLAGEAPGDGPRVPTWVWTGCRVGVRVLALLLAAGALLTVALLVVRGGWIVDLYGELSPGVLGGAVLTGGQLLYLPDLAVWALSWMAGAGFGIGVGSSITISQSTPGLLPLVPILGALPGPGDLPWFTWLFLLVPVGAGALIERLVTTRMGADLFDRALAVTAACLVAAVGSGLFGVLASGSLGSGRLAEVGVPAWLMAGLLGGELALGAALAFGARTFRRPILQRITRTGPGGEASD